MPLADSKRCHCHHASPTQAASDNTHRATIPARRATSLPFMAPTLTPGPAAFRKAGLRHACAMAVRA